MLDPCFVQDVRVQEGERCSWANAAPASKAPSKSRLRLHTWEGRSSGALIIFLGLLSRRPPTWEEVKSELPRGPDVDPDLLDAPVYKDMTQEEAIDLVRRGWCCEFALMKQRKHAKTTCQSAGANVSFHGQHGRMPLHKASERAFPHLIKALCEARADPDGRDQFGTLCAIGVSFLMTEFSW